MEGRVSWYKPNSGWGCLVSHAGRRFSFKTSEVDGEIHGGARVEFKVSEMGGDLVGVNVRVTQSCVDALLQENEQLAREFRSVVAIET
ncbi:MAG: hypothetical protein KAV82_01130 [Phycisphaerae bacterium]|nr:hypothetical protein [Phycisphaerae bacterium]